MEGSLRLWLSKQAHKTYQENCGDGKLFSQFTDLFFWCVILGFRNSPNQIPAEISTRGGTFYWQAFDDDIQKPILKMICVRASGTFNILNPDSQTRGYEKFRDILQNYADLGFSILNARLGGDYSKEQVNILMEILIEMSEIKFESHEN